MVLAEELSFVRAAEKLFISQPPLSRQIKELEEEIGAQLFERNNKSVKLTHAGEFLQKETQKIFAQLDATLLKTKKIAQNISGEYRIAYISSVFSDDMCRLVDFLSQKYPYVNFRLYEAPTVRQIDALENGRIELGIVRAPIISTKLKSYHWFKDGFSWVYSKRHFDLSDSSILANLNFIFFNKDFAPNFHQELIQICGELGFAPNLKHEANNMSSIMQLVINGLGVSIVPKSVLKNYQNEKLGVIEIPENKYFTNVLFITHQNDNSEITKSALEFLSDVKVSTS
jgi:DNA-binding transcriptional LysR family regulator